MTLYVAFGEVLGVPLSLLEDPLDDLEDERRLSTLQKFMHLCNNTQSRQIILMTAMSTQGVESMDHVNVLFLGKTSERKRDPKNSGDEKKAPAHIGFL